MRRKFFDARANDPKCTDHTLALFKWIYGHDDKAMPLDEDSRLAYQTEHIGSIYQRLKD